MIEIKTRCRIRIWVTFSCFLFSSLGFDERRLLYRPGYAGFVIIIIIYLSRHRNVANTPLSPTRNKITKQKSWHWHTMFGESICVTETKRTSLTAGSRRGVYGDLTYTITALGGYIWYSEDETGWAAAPPSPLLIVPNVTTHPSAASVLVNWCLANDISGKYRIQISENIFLCNILCYQQRKKDVSKGAVAEVGSNLVCKKYWAKHTVSYVPTDYVVVILNRNIAKQHLSVVGTHNSLLFPVCNEENDTFPRQTLGCC